MSLGYYNMIPINGFPLEQGNTLDKPAIAFWISTGFMWDTDSFYNEIKFKGLPDINSWNYTNVDLNLAEFTDQFAKLLETIVREQLDGRKAILGLSGGLDSRTLAVALKRIGAKVHTYSYGFEGSFRETKYGKEIARISGWSFDDLLIKTGYLWNKIEAACRINHGYCEFTHPRQIAVAESVAKTGDVFLLGHLGDLLFDDMGVPDDMPFDSQVDILKKKMIKKGGLELATDLWNEWNLEGNFPDILKRRLSALHSEINIDNANARLRFFKSIYSVSRWTSTNLSFFSHYAPIELPYYDDRMCRFVCTIPEKFLAGRQIQIEYIKKYAPELAKVSWQAKEPYNLYNYKKHRSLQHYPWRIKNKINNELRKQVFKKPLILRNWEIQFLGKENDENLRHWLFQNPLLDDLIPKKIVTKYYQKFVNEDKVYWSHALSMLLTLSVMLKNQQPK